MRNLLTSAIASLALATVVVGTASAADTSPRASNPAAEAQLDRDSTHRGLRESPLGVVISPSDQTPNAVSRTEQGVFAPGSSPWLTQSPSGEVIGQRG